MRDRRNKQPAARPERERKRVRRHRIGILERLRVTPVFLYADLPKPGGRYTQGSHATGFRCSRRRCVTPPVRVRDTARCQYSKPLQNHSAIPSIGSHRGSDPKGLNSLNSPQPGRVVACTKARSAGKERHSSHCADRSQSTFQLPTCTCTCDMRILCTCMCIVHVTCTCACTCPCTCCACTWHMVHMRMCMCMCMCVHMYM